MASSHSIGVLDSLVGYHLRRANTAFSASFMRAVAGTDVREALFGILAVVDANPGVNQGKVGNLLGINRANMVPLITELTNLGFIERQVDGADRRAFALELTSVGEEVLKQCLVSVQTHEQRMLRELSASDRSTLVETLSRIITSC